MAPTLTLYTAGTPNGHSAALTLGTRHYVLTQYLLSLTPRLLGRGTEGRVLERWA